MDEKWRFILNKYVVIKLHGNFYQNNYLTLHKKLEARKNICCNSSKL